MVPSNRPNTNADKPAEFSCLDEKALFFVSANKLKRLVSKLIRENRIGRILSFKTECTYLGVAAIGTPRGMPLLSRSAILAGISNPAIPYSAKLKEEAMRARSLQVKQNWE